MKPLAFSAQVERRPVASLKPRQNNPRTHSADQIAQIARSIEQFGFTNPILVHTDGSVIAGHGRLEAAKWLGLEAVPVLCLAHLSAEQARAYVIADNQLALNAGWDLEILREEILALDQADFELDLLGFEAPALDALIVIDGPGGQDEDEPAPPALEASVVSTPGDAWVIGPHRLVCGDARDPEIVRRALGGEQARLLLTDPPFNVPINGHVSGSGRHPEFAMASGEMTEPEFRAFLRAFLEAARPSLADDAMAVVAMDWRGLYTLQTAARQLGLRQINLCVWVKPNGGMGGLYRSRHELFAVYAVGERYTNNVELGRHGRNRTNVWEHPGMSSFGEGREEALAMHPTVKPAGLLREVILDVTGRGDRVLDPFAGSGSSLLAAHQAGRSGSGVEIDPRYVDCAIRRLFRETGLVAHHEGGGEPFPGLTSGEDAL